MLVSITVYLPGVNGLLVVKRARAGIPAVYSRILIVRATSCREATEAQLRRSERSERRPAIGGGTKLMEISASGGKQMRTDIFIIGGGAVGAAVTYFVKFLDPATEVSVIERDPSYSLASTPRGSGGVRRLFSLPENIELSKFSIAFFNGFAETMAVDGVKADVGLKKQGYLFIVPPSGRDVLKRNFDTQQRLGCNVVWLEPDALKQMFPAAGGWAKEICAMLDIRVPIEPLRRFEHYFESREPIEPLPYVKDTARLALRPEGNGYSGGVPTLQEPRGYNFDIDESYFERVVWPALAHRFPQFEHAVCRGTRSASTTRTTLTAM
jgi:glycine/D-amino acid oxidase-like deaminating enzyme